MKTGKKVLCTLLALIVAFVSFCPAVLAEPAPAAAITVTGFEANNVTYQVYPILEPTANWQNNTAGAFQWADWVGNGFLPSSPLAGTTVQDFLAYENSAEPIRTFAEQAKSYVTRNGVAPARSGAVSGSALRLENLTAGSYLLLFADTGTTLYSPMILSLAPQVSNGAWVLNDVTAVVKKSTPAIVKEVKKVSEGEEGYSTSQSASIGDTMQYRITASVPVYGSDYSIVTYRITDEMSAGLSYQG
ncbi:MAG: isopeptide-forming domain-containing fimbrial protein, partial [Gemmiger sp.]